MNRTIADSQGYDVVCMSFGKEQERGIEVVEADKKDSFIIESMEIKTGSCRASDMGFSKDQIAKLMENRKARRTARAISLAKAASQR